jgi:hypothetical protein
MKGTFSLQQRVQHCICHLEAAGQVDGPLNVLPLQGGSVGAPSAAGNHTSP